MCSQSSRPFPPHFSVHGSHSRCQRAQQITPAVQQRRDPLPPTKRAAIHDAFNRVALSLSCTLPMLLEETRRRGIADEDVRRLLSEEETEMACSRGTEMHFQCFRSDAGVFYITRDTGPRNQLASAAEGFAEL